MHPLAFKIKRVHHRILSYGRFLLLHHPHATPARFDLLYAVQLAKGQMSQSELLAQLGVAPSTLSKMLTRLEEIGLIRRARSESDRRAKTVWLTDSGWSHIRIAMYRIFRWDQLQLIFECFFGGESFANFLRVDELWSTMARLAKHLRDTSHLEYPTDHPDD